MLKAKMCIAITGSSGFVGRALGLEAVSRGYAVRGIVRRLTSFSPVIEQIVVGEMNDRTDWDEALTGCDVVVHLAARVHVMREKASDPLAEFRKVNVVGTEHLARCAVKAGVKRFVYVSSVKVNGEETPLGCRYTEADEVSPQDPYGVSKWEAEQALHRVAAETGLEVVIVRPPLVYGAGVKGNFVQMLSVIRKGIPLPLASVHNQRSFIYVKNLVDALLLCATHPQAAGKTYLVSDGEDISTSDLLRKLSAAMGKNAHLFIFPEPLLRLMGRILGKSSQIERLLGSLRIDMRKIREDLGWSSPFSLDDGLKATVRDYFHD